MVATSVGFIGMGVMGRPMANNVMAAGYPIRIITGSERTANFFRAQGAVIEQTARDLAATCDLVLIMVPETRDLERVVGGDMGLLAGAHPGLIVVASGTYQPSRMPVLARRLEKAQAAFLDAPVSGGELAARKGTLSIMVGGDRDAFVIAQPVLERIANQITYMGPSGTGQIAKACNQLVVGSTIVAVAEALSLADAAGLDLHSVREAMLGGFARSRVLEEHGQRMISRNYAPGARTALQAKDASIVLATADDLGLELRSFVAVAALFDSLVEQGY